jgi:hypothetical protein
MTIVNLVNFLLRIFYESMLLCLPKRPKLGKVPKRNNKQWLKKVTDRMWVSQGNVFCLFIVNSVFLIWEAYIVPRINLMYIILGVFGVDLVITLLFIGFYDKYRTAVKKLVLWKYFRAGKTA